jgi:CHAT domain/Tetratricopeptide Repeats-Sensor
VADIISTAGYQVTEAPPGSEGIDVVNRLYEKPYRILHVSAHGVYRAGQGKNRRTGVVLSNGLLLTAAEIAALEVVPDLVFLNCCFTGRLDATPQTPYNRLAYSIARELIESGVRAVIAAGWAVNAERCTLLGSAYKRLASLLHTWTEQGSAEQPQGIREALEQSIQWYQRGEGDPQLPAFRAYNCQNRLALQAVLGIANPEEAKLAIRAGEIAAARYAQSHDYFDVIMQADGRLIACLIDESLQKPNVADTRAVEQEIVAYYQSVREKLPETKRSLDSVLSQITLLVGFYEAQGPNRAGVAHSLRRMYAMLTGTRVEATSDDPIARAAEKTETSANTPPENVDRPAKAAEKRRRGGRAAKRVR